MIDWMQTLGAVQIAVDAIARGDIDEAEIIREWDDEEEGAREGFQLILRKDVLGRHEADKIEAALREAGAE